ncbi:MAG: response regulator [Planctomycetes bacterium]|nr:response regulator [Planctomycetota bacterium]MCH8118276.1 response regulator [Planctomycetota bacterium]
MENAKILIVDDDPDLIKVLQTILESEQYTVITAANRTEGMEKIRINKPDLVILDVMMATCQDGFEMSIELKQNSECKDIPILMLTAVKGKFGIDFKSSAGDPVWLPVDEFLDKPAEPNVLLTKVKKLLSKKT